VHGISPFKYVDKWIKRAFLQIKDYLFFIKSKLLLIALIMSVFVFLKTCLRYSYLPRTWKITKHFRRRVLPYEIWKYVPTCRYVGINVYLLVVTLVYLCDTKKYFWFHIFFI